MNRFRKISILLAFSAGFLAADPPAFIEPLGPRAALAADPSDPRGDIRRFRECRRLRSEGQVNWHAISSGTVNNAGGVAGRGGYFVKACFSTQAGCERWLDRIWHEIPHLDEIHHAYCKPVR